LGVIETTPAFNIYKKWGYKSFNRHMIKKLWVWFVKTSFFFTIVYF
jgi:hypothetical protein